MAVMALEPLLGGLAEGGAAEAGAGAAAGGAEAGGGMSAARMATRALGAKRALGGGGGSAKPPEIDYVAAVHNTLNPAQFR